MANSSTETCSTFSSTPTVVVQKRTDGNWEARREGAARALRVTTTQKGAERFGRTYANRMGARLQFRNASGQIRVK